MTAVMSHYLGLKERPLREGLEQTVLYQPHRNINGHLLICGISGTGKSYQSIRLLNSAARGGLKVDVIDPHEELADVEGAAAVKYSQATGYGFNPLTLDTDIHVGGVERQIDLFTALIKDVTPGLGVKQEGVLRHLLRDTYGAAGIFQDNASSWNRLQITERIHRSIMETRRYNELRKYYPTLEDMRSYAMRKVTALTLGADNKTVTAYNDLAKIIRKKHGLMSKLNKTEDDEEIQKINVQIETAIEKAKETFSQFIGGHTTGRELDDIVKYDSVEVLKGIINRVDLLAASGIFRSNPPPFADARVRIHQIKALTDDQKILFTKLRLREVFEEVKKLGPTESGTELRHVFFIDEAHKFFNDRPDDIINVVAKEARKFGLGLWCASQQPTEFPDSFLTNCGSVVLLGIAAKYWSQCTRMLRIKESELQAIRPKEVIAVKMHRDGDPDPPFDMIVVPNTNNPMGRRAAQKISAPRRAA
jgi:DNA helicase HerA-like ATPase